MSDWLSYQSPKDGQKHFADIDYKRMHGQQGVGFYRWFLGLYVVIHQPKGADESHLALADVAGDLYMQRTNLGDLLVARFSMREKRNRLIAEHFNGTEEFTIEADIDGRRISAIEDLRQGGDLQLEMKLSALAVDTKSGEQFPANVNLRFQATQSDWSKVLQGMGYRRTLLLEIPAFDESNNPNYADAASHIATASEQNSRGHFRQAVAECRLALENIKSVIKDQGEDISDERKLTKEQRIARVNAALMKLTHLAHHADDLSKNTEWQPLDAKAIIMMTGSLLQMASKDGE